MGTGSGLSLLCTLSKYVSETFSGCRLWTGTDALVETAMERPISVLVAIHPRLICKPFFTVFSDQSGIEIDTFKQHILGDLPTQVSSIYGLI